MKLTVNGIDHELSAVTLEELLQALDYEGPWLATAVNGELVHREERAAHRLAERERIEILAPMQGG